MATDEEKLRQLKGMAQLDWLRILSAIVRKYGDDAVVELTLHDLRATPKGGLRRDVDPAKGTLRYAFEYDDPSDRERYSGRREATDAGE